MRSVTFHLSVGSLSSKFAIEPTFYCQKDVANGRWLHSGPRIFTRPPCISLDCLNFTMPCRQGVPDLHVHLS